MAVITVRRANVVLDISDVQKSEYLAKGFDIIGADGKILEKSTPNDPNSLKRAYEELTKKVEKLQKENAALKKKLSEAENKVEEEPKDEPEEEFTPINKRKPAKKTK